MTTAVTIIAIFKIEEAPLEGLFIDPKSDATSNIGTLTWRRRGQDEPINGSPIWRFRSDELDTAANYVEEVVRGNYLNAPFEQVRHLSEAIIAKVKSGIGTDGNGQYMHSDEYYAHIADFDGEPLYSHERALMDTSFHELLS